MQEYNANISITFLIDKYRKNNIGIKQVIVNEQKPDGTYNMFTFYFYQFVEKNAEDYLERGLAYAKSKFHNAAIKYFSHGIMLAPNMPRLYFYRGISYHKTKNYEKAIFDLSKAIEIDPSESTHFSIRGIIYIDLNELDMAKKDISKALELNPNDELAKKCLEELTEGQE